MHMHVEIMKYQRLLVSHRASSELTTRHLYTMGKEKESEVIRGKARMRGSNNERRSQYDWRCKSYRVGNNHLSLRRRFFFNGFPQLSKTSYNRPE